MDPHDWRAIVTWCLSSVGVDERFKACLQDGEGQQQQIGNGNGNLSIVLISWV